MENVPILDSPKIHYLRIPYNITILHFITVSSEWNNQQPQNYANLLTNKKLQLSHSLQIHTLQNRKYTSSRTRWPLSSRSLFLTLLAPKNRRKKGTRRLRWIAGGNYREAVRRWCCFFGDVISTKEGTYGDSTKQPGLEGTRRDEG